jgi:hypothetical protein
VQSVVMLAPEKYSEASRAIAILLSGGITPGITRRPEPSLEFESRRVGGRVHAVVRSRSFVVIDEVYPLPVRIPAHFILKFSLRLACDNGLQGLVRGLGVVQVIE